MAGITKRVSLGLVVALLGASIASMLVPIAASADTNLIIGQEAVISYANGDQVRLRETPDYEGTLIAMYGEGTTVTVLDGPLTDAAGNYWYQVSVGSNVGYIVADFLALASNGAPLEAVAEATEEPYVEETPVDVPIAEVPTETDPVAVVPEAPVAGAVIAIGWVAGTNGDGVRCRAAADTNAPIITVLPEGTQIEITGPAFDIWQPINCMGGGGFIASQFVSTTDPNQAPVVIEDGSTGAETPVAETPVAETPTATVTPVATNPDGSAATETPVATETAVAETPVAEAPTEVVDESAEPVILDESLVSGTAIVSGTNGDGVRCRARASSTSNTITILAEGTSVQLTGVPSGVWQPVYCNGSAGYISKTYLGSGDTVSSTDGGTVGSTDGVTQLAVGAEVSAAALTGSALVSGTNGDGVRCRTNASYSGSIIAVISEGTSLSLRGLATGEWQPVICAGSNGFIHVDYLSSSGSTSGGSTSGGSGDVDTSAVTGSATVNSAPGGLNCRASGSMSGSIITVLAHGSTVSLRGAASNGWQPVVCAGRNGFVSSQYLTSGGTSGGGTSGGGTNGGGTSGGSASSGSTMYVSGTGGGGVRLRSSGSMSGSILAVVPEGASVTVRNGSTSGWIAVTYNGTNGFISADYLAKNGGSTSGGGTSGGGTNGGGTSGGSTSGMVNGDHAKTSDSLNLRYSASYSAGVAAVAPAGTVVLITGSATNGFYPVDWDGLSGFMASQYLTKTTEALSDRGGSGNPNGGTNGGTTGGSSSGGASGNALVSYAMRYLGYPYVWATHGPSSFDCSGFTYWVVLNVLGRDIGAGTWTQVSAGASVSRGNLQPGDLVFFQNTYTTGLSHVGMYIGNDQFIHAQNEATGVVISDLNSSYYSSRWYGAVRLT